MSPSAVKRAGAFPDLILIEAIHMGDPILYNDGDARALASLMSGIPGTEMEYDSGSTPASRGYALEMGAIRARIRARIRACVRPCRCGGCPDVAFDGVGWRIRCACGRTAGGETLAGAAESWRDDRWRTQSACGWSTT